MDSFLIPCIVTQFCYFSFGSSTCPGLANCLLCYFDMIPSFFGHSLTFWHDKMCQTHLVFSLPHPRNGHFSKKSSLLQWGKISRNEDLNSMCLLLLKTPCFQALSEYAIFCLFNYADTKIQSNTTGFFLIFPHPNLYLSSIWEPSPNNTISINFLICLILKGIQN